MKITTRQIKGIPTTFKGDAKCFKQNFVILKSDSLLGHSMVGDYEQAFAQDVKGYSCDLNNCNFKSKFCLVLCYKENSNKTNKIVKFYSSNGYLSKIFEIENFKKLKTTNNNRNKIYSINKKNVIKGYDLKKTPKFITESLKIEE